MNSGVLARAWPQSSYTREGRGVNSTRCFSDGGARGRGWPATLPLLPPPPRPDWAARPRRRQSILGSSPPSDSPATTPTSVFDALAVLLTHHIDIWDRRLHTA